MPPTASKRRWRQLRPGKLRVVLNNEYDSVNLFRLSQSHPVGGYFPPIVGVSRATRKLAYYPSICVIDTKKG